MKSPSRIPVRAEQFLLNAIGICWPMIKNDNIRFHLNVLAEQLHQELDKKMGRVSKKEQEQSSVENTEGEDIRKFIAMFRERYAHETDTEYNTKLDPDEIGLIKSVVKKLREKDIEVEDYLSWVFDVFYEDQKNREKFSPIIKVICATFMTSKFFMTNRSKFRKKKAEEEAKNHREAVRNRGKTLFRQTKDEEIQKMLLREYNRNVTLGYLEKWLKEKERKIQKEGNKDG